MGLVDVSFSFMTMARHTAQELNQNEMVLLVAQTYVKFKPMVKNNNYIQITILQKFCSQRNEATICDVGLLRAMLAADYRFLSAVSQAWPLSNLEVGEGVWAEN